MKTFYKFLVSGTVLVILNNSFPAQANDDKLWIPISNRTNGSTYLDVNSITPQGNTKTFWLYISVNQPSAQGWSKILAEGVANCSTKDTTYRQAKVYDSQDRVVKSLSTEGIKQLNIEAIAAPDATNEELAALVCSSTQ
ncbi:hypothetical protein NUACC21_61950 [Scytonema sp. NUACC21]